MDLEYVTTQMPPNATGPVPPAERQSYRVTHRRGTGKDACTQGIQALGGDAS